MRNAIAAKNQTVAGRGEVSRRRRAPQDPAPAATAGETPTDENEGLPAEAGERPERQDGEEVTQRGTTGRVEGEHRGEGRVG